MILMRNNSLSVKTGLLHEKYRNNEKPAIFFSGALPISTQSLVFSDVKRDFMRKNYSNYCIKILVRRTDITKCKVLI
jgi:hypothetical protein